MPELSYAVKHSVAHLWTLANWLMLAGDTLSIAATQHQAITRSFALSLAHSIGAALLAWIALLVLAALHLHYTQAVLAHLNQCVTQIITRKGTLKFCLCYSVIYDDFLKQLDGTSLNSFFQSSTLT